MTTSKNRGSRVEQRFLFQKTRFFSKNQGLRQIFPLSPVTMMRVVVAEAGAETDAFVSKFVIL